MEPVFRLVENDGLRTVDDLVGHFFAAMGRQAMEEHGAFGRVLHERWIHLVRCQVLLAKYWLARRRVNA